MKRKPLWRTILDHNLAMQKRREELEAMLWRFIESLEYFDPPIGSKNFNMIQEAKKLLLRKTSKPQLTGRRKSAKI